MTRPAKRPPALENQLCYAVYAAGMTIQRLYKPLLDRMGLTYPQYLVLNLLWREDQQMVGRLAEQLALEPSTLTPLLKRLEAAGIVRRVRNPQDERQVIVALTEKGATLEREAACLGEALLVASGQSPEALGALNRTIRDLRDHLETARRRDAPPTRRASDESA